MVMVFGEIATKATVDYEKIVRDTCRFDTVYYNIIELALNSIVYYRV